MSEPRKDFKNLTLVRHASTEALRRDSEEEKRANPNIKLAYYHPTRLFGEYQAKHPETYNGVTDPLIGVKLPTTLEPQIWPIEKEKIKIKSP